ncbi:MAG: hypothetical protein FJ388_07460 [Verrucomicrobia bacterium]|nr:hypothetical protein [Verrucomicrobiota bacterium]
MPENKSHLGLVGIRAFIPPWLPMKAACEWARLLGGATIVNHPGPGPSMWEPDYWERPGLRDKIDALEIYNGRVVRLGSIGFDARYREAISYGGLGLKIAAIGATDSHGAGEPPEAATFALATNCATVAVVDAIRARRTVASSGFSRLELNCAHLGEVIRTSRLTLALQLTQTVERITLFRETDVMQVWSNAASASVALTATNNVAFSWMIEDGSRHAYTFGIWVEPQPQHAADLVVTAEDIRIEGRTVRATIHNRGDMAATNFFVRFVDGLPYAGGAIGSVGRVAERASVQSPLAERWRVQLHVSHSTDQHFQSPPYAGGRIVADMPVEKLDPGASVDIRVDLPAPPIPGSIIYVKADPESFALDCDDDRVAESNERNNAAMRIVTRETP